MKSIVAACVIAISLTTQTQTKHLDDSLRTLATADSTESVVGNPGIVAELGSRVPRSSFAPVFVFFFLLFLSFVISFVLYRLIIWNRSSETE